MLSAHTHTRAFRPLEAWDIILSESNIDCSSSVWRTGSVAMSVIGQCQISAILLNNQNAKFINGLTIDMLGLIMS